MSPLVALGLRLARGASRTDRLRAVLVIGACAIATTLLLAVFAVTRIEAIVSGGHLEREDRVLYAAIAATIGLPVLMLLVTVTRLSASIRDRRLAALRLLGLPPGRTRAVAAVEAGVLALVGLVPGTAVFYAVWPLVAGMIRFGRDSTAAGISPTVEQFLAVVVCVPLVAVVVSLAPTRAVTARPLAVRRGAPVGRPSLFRVLPILAGIALLATMFRVSQDPATSGDVAMFWPFLAGAVLAGLGLPVVVPVLVRTVADVLARTTRRPAVIVAARRLQLEPAATTRLVAGLLLAVFVVTGARCVLTAWERTPQYVEAYHAAYVGPQVIDVRDTSGGKPVDLGVLAAESAVRKVVPATIVEGNCDEPNEVCGNAYVGTCAELRRLVSVQRCRDDQVAWLRPTSAPKEDPLVPPGTPIEVGPGPAGSSTRIEVPAPSAEITWSGAAPESTYQFLLSAAVFLPRSAPGAADLIRATVPTYVIYADPGKQNQQIVLGAVGALLAGEYGAGAVDYSTLEQVDNYRYILWSVTTVVVLVGLTAFGIAAVDRATERRREVASLRILGAHVALARTSQLLQALIPLGLGIPVAAGLGLLAGTGYLAFGGIRAYAPWPSVVTTAVVATVAALLVAAATVPALGRAVDPRMLRRE
jgi:putative ABC transport system permease protein